jgi:hypothetical protein
LKSDETHERYLLYRTGTGTGLMQLTPVWRIRDVYPRFPDPDFYPSRIPDPKTATKERGEKKFDVATNFTKLYIILVLKC